MIGPSVRAGKCVRPVTITMTPMSITTNSALSVGKVPADGGAGDRISHAAASQLYWTVFQMLAHHTANGCNLRSGDLFGTGTISVATPTHSGCLLEVTANGSKPFELSSSETRTFLEDGDEVILTAACERDGFRRIGFGECRGVVAPAA